MANLPAQYRSHTAQLNVTPYCIIQPGGGCAPNSKTLSLTQQPQKYWDYCGPATASEILTALGSSRTQDFVAGSAYLDTVNTQQTSWDPQVMAPTLNTLQSRLYYATQQGSWVNEAQWQSDLVTDISLYGQPIAGNTVEPSGGSYLAGHWNFPSSAFPLFYWVAIYGYVNNGQYSVYADSVSGATWVWSWATPNNVPPSSTYSSSQLYTLLSQRGWVW